MGRKKILWLCSWYPSATDPFNGDFIQRHARAAALYNDIHVIHVVGCVDGQMAPQAVEIREEAGLTEQLFYFNKSQTIPGRLLAQFQWTSLFRKGIRQYINRQGLPDLVHVQIPMKAGLLALWMRRKYHIPYLVTEHWGIYNEVEKLNYAGRSSLFKKYTRNIFRQAAAFISVSHYLAAGVNRLVLEKEYTVIPNVTDTRLFHPGTAKAPRFRFIHVSNMVPLKNAEGILRAFHAIIQAGEDAELVMVGNQNQLLPALMIQYGLSPERVFFKGEVAYVQVAAEMRQAHALLVFSDIENSPCVIGEALCCGLPVIATRTGGIPELVNEENAILVNPRDETGLAEAMKTVMHNRKIYRPEQIAEKARTRFGYETAGKQMDSLYQQYAGNTRKI